MIRRIVAHALRNLTDLHFRIDQKRGGIGHPELLDQRRKAAAGILLDQRTQMGLAVVEKFCQRRQRQRLVIVLDILQDQGKIRYKLVILELHRFTVIPQ